MKVLAKVLTDSARGHSQWKFGSKHSKLSYTFFFSVTTQWSPSASKWECSGLNIFTSGMEGPEQHIASDVPGASWRYS